MSQCGVGADLVGSYLVGVGPNPNVNYHSVVFTEIVFFQCVCVCFVWSILSLLLVC